MKIILDNNVPVGVIRVLSENEVATCPEMAWTKLENGDLMAAAEAAGFELMITADQNIQYQQNMADRQIALLVLGSNHWQTVRQYSAQISLLAQSAVTGSYAFIGMPTKRVGR